MTEMDVPLETIILDPRLQMRATMDFETIDEYAEVADDLPPGKIVMGPNEEMWLTGGWHRYHARGKAEKDTMKCVVREGTFQDALREAAGENHGHGIKRTDADKRRAVSALLNDENWVSRSDRMIAEVCHVGHPFVAKVRTENACGIDSTSPQRTDSTGRKQPATKPKKETPRCYGCRKLWPDSNTSRVGCVACHAARKEAKDKKKPHEEDDEPFVQETNEMPPAPIVDDNGNHVPEKLLPVFRAVALYKKAGKLMTSLAKVYKEIEACPARVAKPIDPAKQHFEKYTTVFKSARWRIVNMVPALVCKCPKGYGCSVCHDKGWLTREEAEVQEIPA